MTAPEQVDETLPVPEHLRTARAVLSRGLRGSQELRRGLALTVVISLAAATAELVAPILIQQIFDHGFRGGFRAGFVFGICGASIAVIAGAFLAGRAAARRLVDASEQALMTLRVQTFSHLHELSLAEQSRARRGTLVARVTADVDTLSEFTEWSGMAWIVSLVQIAGALTLMLFYSWQLTIPVILLVGPLLAIVLSRQTALSEAFDLVRTRVGQMLSEVSESVMGAGVIRAYGLQDPSDNRVKESIDRRYLAQAQAHFHAATLFPIAGVFWGASLAVIVFVGATYGPRWGLTFGQVAAFLFLADLFLHPFTTLPEIYTQTQTAISGWRKILAVLDMPIEIVEPSPGVELPPGAPDILVESVSYAYGPGRPVLRDVSAWVAPGAHVAVVGRTGSGKSTFVRLLTRLADPIQGRIQIGGVELATIAPTARRAAIRMVPQDGFLFSGTVRDNIRIGWKAATDRDVETAILELGLSSWVEALPDGFDTQVGQRGEALSVGERQLVSIARAHIGNPRLLILDEATSAVDPATERRISEALRRAAAGRTTVTVAHRLSTAEAADVIFVFENGRIVEHGTHADLVTANGVYALLHGEWLGSVAGERPR